MHSAASDGTDNPAQLVENIQKAGIRTFALTDHDTIDGCSQVEALVPPALRFIRGVEFSCITSAGKCHILGYGYRPEAPSIHQALEAGRVLRQAKLNRRLDHLEKVHGIRFSEEELRWLAGLNSPGKPHLAQLILDRGLADTREEAITRYINGCKGGDARIDGAITSGGMPGLKAFVAAVFGGIGSIPGAVVGAFIIGLCEEIIKGLGYTTFSDAFTFALLIVVLCVKPTGLFGEKVTDKV